MRPLHLSLAAALLVSSAVRVAAATSTDEAMPQRPAAATGVRVAQDAGQPKPDPKHKPDPKAGKPANTKQPGTPPPKPHVRPADKAPPHRASPTPPPAIKAPTPAPSMKAPPPPPPAPKVVPPPPPPAAKTAPPQPPPPAAKTLPPPVPNKVLPPATQAPVAPQGKLAPTTGTPTAPVTTNVPPPTMPAAGMTGMGASPTVTPSAPTAPAVAAPAPVPNPTAPGGGASLKPGTAAGAAAAVGAAGAAGLAVGAAATTAAPTPAPTRLQDIQQKRVQRQEGASTIIQEDNRVIIKQDNRVFIQNNDSSRFTRGAKDVRTHQRDGLTETVIMRPGGVQIVNVTNPDGRLVRRYRREGGREVDLIDNRGFFSKHGGALAAGIGIGVLATAAIVALAPPAVAIPRHKYIVDYDRASRDDIYEALSAPPIERLDRSYSLMEIRYSPSLRDRMRRIDLDTINFDTGSWHVDSDQYGKLENIAYAIRRVIDRDPREVFLIEGHTDAVGSDVDNATLSDRRAESVADILSSRFDIPPENIVTQGYGEQYLKIETRGPERANRRVAIRRITPLLAHTGH